MASDLTPQQKFHKTLRMSIYGLIATAIVCIIIGTLWKGSHGLWSAVIGIAIGAAFVLITIISFVSTMKKPPTTMAAVVLGGWLVKILVLMIVFAGLRKVSFVEPKVMGLTIVLSLLVTLAAEVKSTL